MHSSINHQYKKQLFVYIICLYIKISNILISNFCWLSNFAIIPYFFPRFVFLNDSGGERIEENCESLYQKATSVLSRQYEEAIIHTIQLILSLYMTRKFMRSNTSC